VARFVGRADHVGGTPLPRGTSSGHECFLAVKPNQPEDDGEYGVPDVALPNVALPISHRQLPACHIKSPQSARPLIRGHEREANGTKQDKCRDHSRLSSPARRLCPNPVHTTTAEKFKLRHYRIWARSSACRRRDRLVLRPRADPGMAVRGNYERRAHRQSQKGVLMETAVTAPRMIIRIKGAKWKCSHPSF
jgi:hypothetical protein